MALSLPREMPFPFLTLPPRAGSQPSKQASKGNAGHGAPAFPRSLAQQPPLPGHALPRGSLSLFAAKGRRGRVGPCLGAPPGWWKKPAPRPDLWLHWRGGGTSRDWPYSRRWGELRRRPARPRCPAWLPGLMSRRPLASLTSQGLAQLGSSRHAGSSYPPHPAGCEPRQQAGDALAFTLPDAAAGTPFATKQEISSVLPRLPACLRECLPASVCSRNSEAVPAEQRSRLLSERRRCSSSCRYLTCSAWEEGTWRTAAAFSHLCQDSTGRDCTERRRQALLQRLTGKGQVFLLQLESTDIHLKMLPCLI